MDSSIEILIAKKSDCEEIQALWNHKEIIAGLGGFTILDNLYKHVVRGKASLWLARDTETKMVVGAMEVGGRGQVQLMKFGSVGVHPDYRCRGIATTMYFALACQGVLEGRRLFEDTIVGDNPHQFIALPKMGLDIVGTFRHKTASAKDIVIFQFDLMTGGFEKMSERFLKYGHRLQVLESYFTETVWPRNAELAAKHILEFWPKMVYYRDWIKNCPQIDVTVDMQDPTDARRDRFKQQTLTGD